MTSCIGPEILKIPIQVYDQEVFLQMKVVPSVVKKKKKKMLYLAMIPSLS